MSAAVLINKLEGVRQTGPGRWLARCPAHEDRSPSLSIRELDDGRVLVHCFAACAPDDVLAVLGLSMPDLFPTPLGSHFTPSKSRIPAADALAALDHETLVVAIIANDFLEHRTIDGPTWARLASAVAKIGEVRVAAAPAKVPR